MNHAFTRGALALCLAFSLALSGCGGSTASSAPAATSTPIPTAAATPTPQPTPTPKPTPDPALGFLDESAFVGTVLPETPDAGEEYIADTLFVGDSNTVRYEMFGFTGLQNNLACAGMGVGSITSFPCVDMNGYKSLMLIPQAIETIQPERVIFGFGSNNLLGDAATAVKEYRAAIRKCYDGYPYFTVIVSAVPPLGEGYSDLANKQAKVDALNKAFAEMCAEEGWYFLNSAEAMKDWETGFAVEGYTIQDGLHLSEEGIAAYIDYVRTHAVPETPSRRPMPLAAVPSHNRSPVDMLVHPSPTPNKEQAPSGSVTIEYKLSGQGRLDGNLKQTVKKGDAAEGVWVYPAESYQFTHWEINIPNQSYSEQECLRLTIPEDFTGSKVTATAFTEYVEEAPPEG